MSSGVLSSYSELPTRADRLLAGKYGLGQCCAGTFTMKQSITLETAIIVIKYAISPISCWPPPIGSSTFVILRHNLCLWLGLIHHPLAIAAAAYSAYLHRDDIVRVLKIMTEIVAMVSVFIKMIICKIEAPRLRVLIAKMETFLQQATREEKELIQSYVDKCLAIHAIVFVSVILGPIMFITAPLLTSQRHPGDSAYPFPIDSYGVLVCVYISQSISTIQVGCMIILDIFFAILLWYAGARFQILSLKFRNATTVADVISCARQHQELIRYTDQLKITIGIIAAEVSVFAIFVIGAGGLVLIGDPPMYEVAKYVFFEIGAAMELFLLSWPADNLTEVSQRVADAAFNCEWIGKSPVMLKNLLIVSQRSRNPIVISVDGLLPVLSLEFYGSTIAASFSYLTTLRAMTAD